jgi:hypothetical protein
MFIQRNHNCKINDCFHIIRTCYRSPSRVVRYQCRIKWMPDHSSSSIFTLYWPMLSELHCLSIHAMKVDALEGQHNVWHCDTPYTQHTYVLLLLLAYPVTTFFKKEKQKVMSYVPNSFPLAHPCRLIPMTALWHDCQPISVINDDVVIS